MANVTLSGPATPSTAVNYAFDICFIEAAPDVTFFSGSSGTGQNAAPPTGIPAAPAIHSSGATAVSIQDGTYQGGAGHAFDEDGPAPGVVSLSDGSFSVSGGTITGGAGGPSNGAPGLTLVNPGGGSITGGTVTGGPAAVGSNLSGGTGLVVSLTDADYTVSGGTISGGASDGSGPPGIALGFTVRSPRTLTISGGTWTGPCVGRIEYGGTVRVHSSPGFVPTMPDGSALTATPGTGYVDYTP